MKRDNIKIKVCGMRDADNIAAVAQLDIDLMGFIFYPRSPRYVQMITASAGIIPDYSPQRLREARTGKKEAVVVPRVGVFVDDMPQNIITRVFNFQLDYVQLHGDESPVMIDNLRRSLDPDIRPGVKIIKALGIASAADLAKAEPYHGVADLLLFDTSCEEKGGSGRPFAWDVLQQYDGPTPFILSGGIGPDDVEALRAFDHPLLAGIDLNSRFETEPGVKDVDALATFISRLKGE